MLRSVTAARLACLLVGLSLIAPARSASVRMVGFDELVQSSALVFHGRVLAARSRWLPAEAGIVTDVEFAVIETYAGDAPGRLVLGFAGGEIDGVGMRVHGLTMPSEGEEGVFFVERLDRPQVNPLYGWDQGHYRVRRDGDGVPRVFSTRGRPLLRAGSAPSPAQVRLSQGLPVGVEAGDDADHPGMTLAEFADAIRRVATSAGREAR
jgi:hypothetical protein